MATFTVANGGGNINAASTFTAGVGTPGAADVINFTATSGQLTVNAITTIQDIDFSGYTNVITFTAALNVSRNITFNTSTSTYTTAGAEGIQKTGTGTIVSNNKTWTAGFTFSAGTYTVTLNDKMTVSGTVTFANNNTVTLSPNNVLDPERFDVTGNFTISGGGVLTGTALIKFTGTANQTLAATNAGTIRTNVKVDKTGGTLTFTGSLNYNTGTFTYVQGTTNTGTSTLVVSTATTTFNTNGSTAGGATTTSSTGINWYSLTLSTTLNLTSNFTVINTLTANVGTITRSASENVYLGGSLTMTSTLTSTAAAVIMNGTGTWSGAGAVTAPLTINTTGTLTISGSVTFSTRTLTYTTAASVVTTGSTLNITASCTLATNGITWVNVTLSATSTITLSNNLAWNGTFSMTSGTITFAGVGSMSGAALTITTNATVTLNSDITCTGLVTLGSTTATTILSSSGGTRTIITSGGITNGTTSGSVVCNINIKVTGGTITSGANSATGAYYTINTTYQFEIDGNVTFASSGAFYIYGGVNTGTGGTFKHTSGTVTTTGSTAYFHSIFINSGSITWNNVWILSGAATISVLQSDMAVNGLLTLGYLTIAFTINNDGTTRTINANGGITMSGSTSIVSGTANIKATAGTITGISSTQLRNNLELAGNVTFASGVTFGYNTGILLYTSGTITTTNSTLAIATTTTLNTNGVTWFNITSTGAATLTLSSNFTWTGTFSATTGTVTFAGAGSLISSSGALSLSGSCAMTIKNALSLTTLTVTSNGTTTLTGDLTCTGLVSLGANGVTTTLSSSGGARTIIATNGITNPGTTSVVICNINIKVTGGTITSSGNPATGGYYQVNTTYQFEIDGNVTFASSGAFYIYGGVTTGTGGTFKYTSGIVTTTGSSFYFHASMYINSGTIAWNNVWILSGSASTAILQSNVTVNGLLTLGYTTAGYIINNDGTTRTITAAGGITLSGTTSVVSGTANLTCTGGTITGVSSVQLRLNLTLNGNITFASGVTFSYNTGTLTYTSGTITTTNSTLSVATSTTFVTNGMIWNIINWSGGTLTLTNALTATGLITASHQLPILNGSDLFANGGMTFTALQNGANLSYISGSSTIRFEGTGSWTSTQQGTYRNNVIINPTSSSFTINIYYVSGTITYNSSNGGNVTSANVVLGYYLATAGIGVSRSTTFDTNAMRWDFIDVQKYTNTGTVTTTLTLNSNLNVAYIYMRSIGSANNDILNFTIAEGANLVNVGTFNQDSRITINLSKDFTCKTLAFSTGVFGRLNNNTITVTDLLTSQATAVNTTWTGTTKIVLADRCTWSRTSDTGPISFTMEFQGHLTLGSTAFPLMTYNASTLTYTGRKNAKVLGRLAIGTSTMTNMHKVTFQSLTITSGATITMNQFFGGSPDLKSTIAPSSTTNYTISFSDALEKIARHVNVSRATISRPGQLSIITDNCNKGNNVGIKFAPNQVNNGISRNLPATDIQLGFGTQSLIKDPLLS